MKLNEDVSEPAYLAYINAEIQNGTGVLYDLGVAVGNNKAKGAWQNHLVGKHGFSML